MAKSIRVCWGSVFKPIAERTHIVLIGAKRPWESSQFFSSDQNLVVIGQLQKDVTGIQVRFCRKCRVRHFRFNSNFS